MPTPLLSEESPLRKPPASFSRRQMMVLDGIRYAAEMAHLAYERLRGSLQAIESVEKTTVVQNAEALKDAWSIVDSVNRYRDLLANMPGLNKAPWTRLLAQRTEDAASLRDCIQHQLGELKRLADEGGQVWGYLSWAGMRDGRPTGIWYMLSGGSDYAGDQWLFAGPVQLPFRVPPDRIRLNAYGRQVYLWRLVTAVATATRRLESAVSNGEVRPVGVPATERRGADVFYSASILVVMSNDGK